ncbi:amidohydrolase family protein [bacterium]|jgi:uncharacterized protein|nr:amidohydrolase family protein [bacterium]MBT3581114.1 amidohydrolase family protein [bacterium]MBT4552575.1 amidohydrolase family protein [bacterium]MBT5988238.1 amidohydrolase family protein [bacterium]MBT7087917.1 amidohydrolase family protein [bacterium]
MTFPQAIDFHTHLGSDIDGISYTQNQLLNSMKEAHISDAVIFPFHEKDTDILQASLNLKAKTQNPNLYPFLRFDPKKTTPKQLASILDGFYGVKLHPSAQIFDPLDPVFFPLYEIITQKEKPLLFHTRKENNPHTDPERILTLAEQFPKLILVIGHFGNASKSVFEAMKRHPNIYLETSIMGSTPHSIRHAAQHIGTERILFGSDAPYSDQLIEKLKIERSQLSTKEIEQILYYNAQKLLKI